MSENFDKYSERSHEERKELKKLEEKMQQYEQRLKEAETLVDNAKKERMEINFVPPSMPTQAELTLATVKEQLLQADTCFQEEVNHVADRVRFLIAKYGRQAVIGATIATLEYQIQHEPK